VALVLSPIARAAIPGNVPMFGIQAPTPGSGKGLLADAAAMIPTGRRAPLMAPTDEDEETRKEWAVVSDQGGTSAAIPRIPAPQGARSARLVVQRPVAAFPCSRAERDAPALARVQATRERLH